MKNVFSKVATYVVLPCLIVMALSSLLNPMVPSITVPTVVISNIVDSGERWYNPFSWGLDESAAIAHSQAQEAATVATSAAVRTSTAFAIGAVWTGLALMAIALSVVSTVQNKGQIAEAYKSRKSTVSPKTKTPKPNGEQDVEQDYEAFMTGATTPKHKKPTAEQEAARFGQEEQIANHPAVV